MRRSREAFIAKLHAECPHHVDLIPPPDGFAYETWEAIYEFIDARIGATDNWYGQRLGDHVDVGDGPWISRYSGFLPEPESESQAKGKLHSAASSTKQIGSSRTLLNSRPTACQRSELTCFVQRSNDAPCWRSIQVPARR